LWQRGFGSQVHLLQQPQLGAASQQLGAVQQLGSAAGAQQLGAAGAQQLGSALAQQLGSAAAQQVGAASQQLLLQQL
jgi:hypothetical protein